MIAPQIDRDRLLNRLAVFNRIGALPGGGNCRLALTDQDRAGRDLLVQWMKALGLTVTIDAIGNIVGVRPGREDVAPVMAGSHIDTVGTGGSYDGLYGVLAALEVCEAFDDAKVTTRRPVAVAAFTNEEGARFAPFALGSLVYAGGLGVEEAYESKAIDGATIGEELQRIGYSGDAKPGWLRPHAYVELHIEQGPILEAEKTTIGVVEAIQGVSWTEVSIAGRSSHAGTTPMRMRRDAGYAASRIAVFVRELAHELGGNQVATVGRMVLTPNLVNVVANSATLTVDLRNTDEQALRLAETRLAEFLKRLGTEENLTISTKSLARFAPVPFPEEMVSTVENAACDRQMKSRRLPSGAGHDAQMMARICPSSMIFVPSRDGLSHNVREHTEPEHLEAGATVLMDVMLRLAA